MEISYSRSNSPEIWVCYMYMELNKTSSEILNFVIRSVYPILMSKVYE